MTHTYCWQGQDSAGAEISGPGLEQRFSDQSDAESFISATWPDLLAAGVAAVTLFDGDELVYGPMPLTTQ